MSGYEFTRSAMTETHATCAACGGRGLVLGESGLPNMARLEFCACPSGRARFERSMASGVVCAYQPRAGWTETRA